MTLSKISLIVLAGGLSGLDAAPAYSVHGSDWCPLLPSGSKEVAAHKSKRLKLDSGDIVYVDEYGIDDSQRRMFYDNGDCFEAQHKNQLVGGLRSGNGTMYLEGHNGATKIKGYWTNDKLVYVIGQSEVFTTDKPTQKLEKTGKKLSSTLYSGQMLKTGSGSHPVYVRHGYGELSVRARTNEKYAGMWLNDKFLVPHQHGKITMDKKKIEDMEKNVEKNVDNVVGYARENAKTEMTAIKDQLIEQAKADLNKLKEDVNKEIHKKLDTEAKATYDIYKTERHASIRARENLDQHLRASNEAFIKILREQHEKNLKDLQAHHEKSIAEKEASLNEAMETKESAVNEAIEKWIKENSSTAVAVTTALLITIGTFLF